MGSASTPGLFADGLYELKDECPPDVYLPDGRCWHCHARRGEEHTRLLWNQVKIDRTDDVGAQMRWRALEQAIVQLDPRRNGGRVATDEEITALAEHFFWFLMGMNPIAAGVDTRDVKR